MIKTNNPAGRLYMILEAAKAAPGGADGYQTWAGVFKVPPYEASAPERKMPDESAAEALGRFLQVRTLVNEVESALRSIENINHSLYLTPFSRIRAAFSLHYLNGGNYPGAVLGQITEGDMTVLAFCAEALDAQHSESVVEEEQLKELLDAVAALYEEVRAADVGTSLKEIILDQLEIIRRAVHEYRIRGVVRLQEALNTVVGSYVLNKEVWEQSADLKEVKDYKQVLSRFAAVVSFASNTVKLLEAAARYIPPLLPGGA
jgi:hypothetical protein